MPKSKISKPKRKTIVYIDGFNLYYCALKGSGYKWLDLMKVSQILLNDCEIIGIRYYTAHVSNNVSPTAPADQAIYLNALKTLPNLEIILGRFQVTQKFMYLKKPLEFKPDSTKIDIDPEPNVVKVVKTEEKGSDVNLGVQLVRDAFLNKFEHAAVITNDTDLTEAIRIVEQEARLPVTLICPEQIKSPAKSLQDVATTTKRLRLNTVCRASQFPNSIITANGNIINKPNSW